MRTIHPDLLRTLQKERKMAFVAGPRQVGKTTLAEALLKESGSLETGYFNWDNEETRRRIIAAPLAFWKPELLPAPNRIALDEIHKYPRWKRFLKGFYDTHKKEVEVIVTGSGSLDVYQKGGDSLFGRYHLFHLFPFSLGELLETYNGDLSPEACLAKILDSPAIEGKDRYESLWRFNGFPEPLFGQEERLLARWQNDHRQLLLREDLRDLTQIRELGLVETLMNLLPERIGSPLSVNALREDIGVNFKTVQNWLTILNRLYYLFAIRPYSGRLARTLRREEKVYFFDWSELEREEKRIENLVAVHLQKCCFYWTESGYGRFELYYLRDKEKREVDFLICNKQKPYLLVEVKLSEKEIDRSLYYFAERLRPKYAFQVVGKGPAELLSEKAPGLYLSSVSRFLAPLP